MDNKTYIQHLTRGLEIARPINARLAALNKPAVQLQARAFMQAWKGVGFNARVRRQLGAMGPASKIPRLKHQLDAMGAASKISLPPIVPLKLGGVPRFSDHVRKLIDAHAISFKEQLQRALPPNWLGMSHAEMDEAIAFSEATGVNLVWLPRRTIIDELVEAGPDDAIEILVQRQEEILVDIRHVLGEVTHGDSADWLRLAECAVEVAEEGQLEAAQALATNILSGIVEHVFAMRLRDAREEFRRDDPDHVALRVFRMTVLLRVFGRALITTDQAGPGFNRHASTHLFVESYTPANAIAALMLLAGVVRELDVLYRRHEQREAEEAAKAAA
jgi:hypothetical protein